MLNFTKTLCTLIIFVSILEKGFCFNHNNNITDIAAISSFLQHFNNEFDRAISSQITFVLNVRHQKAKHFWNELISEYSKLTNHIKIMLKCVDQSYKHSFDYFNVLFIDSYESFRKIDFGPATATQDFSEYYLVIFYSLSKNAEQDIQNIFNYFWQYYIVNVVLVLQSQNAEQQILLYTYYPFTSQACKKVQLRVLNRNQSALKLKRSQMFPKKFQRFHNCSLTAALWDVPPYIILPKPGWTSKQIVGIEGYLLKVLAETLEFRTDYVTPPNNEQRGLVKADGSLTGALKMLKQRTADFSLGSFRCTLSRSTISSPSLTYLHTVQVFTALALRTPWSSMEIMAYPFQVHIWIILVVLLSFMMSSTYMLHVYRPQALRFIYGFRSVQLININIVAIALSQVAPCVPRRNFARHIVLMWILLTMILRSIYQGALYEFLKSNKNIAPPNTVAELIERKYKLIVNVATNDSISGTQIMRDNLIEILIMNITDSGGFALLESNPTKNYVTGTPKDFLTYYVKCHKKHGVFHVLKQQIFSQQLCIYFSKHSYLVETFNDKLRKLENFGLIDHWTKKFLDGGFVDDINEATTETPLTLSQLLGIVKIALYLYVLAFMLCIGEIFWFKFKCNK